MTTDLKKFEEKRKTNLANTIGSTFWLGMEELSKTISWSKDSAKKTETTAKNQISLDLDKYENLKIHWGKSKV